jgi:chemotaxis protein CheY-P-specific phosphatase CheC
MDDLTEHTRSVATTVLESFELGTPPAQNDNDTAGAAPVRCSVSIDGEWHGVVVVALSPRLVAWIARRMFGAAAVTAETLADDCREAAREVSNIVAGNLKPLFGMTNALGLPQDLAAISPTTDGAVAHVRVEHCGEALEIHILQAA